MSCFRSDAGFTLVELLVVIAVGLVLSFAAAPSLELLLNAYRIGMARDAMFASITLARSEAIKRNSRAVLCKSPDGQSCATAGRWDQGWIVFHDLNNNAVRNVGEAIVAHESGLGASVRLSGNPPVSSYLSFTPMGSAKSVGGGFQSGRFTFCRVSTSPEDAHQIIISPSGRARILRTKVDDCL